MNLRKRTLALFLTVCLLLSFTVPMVSAVTLTSQSFGLSGTKLDAGDIEFIPELDGENFKWYSGTSYPGIYFRSESDVYSIRINLDNSGNPIAAGDYRFTFRQVVSSATNSGLVGLYVLPGNTPENEIANKVADDTYFAGTIDTTGGTYTHAGEASLPGGSVILAFKPLTAIPSSGAIRFVPRTIILVNDMTCSDVTGLKECIEAVNASEQTKGHITIKLNGDIDTGTEEIIITERMHLDLNGHTLTGSNITINGKLNDSSNGIGIYKTAPKTLASDDLLLYDSENKGYRVYNDFTVAPHGTSLQDMGNGAKRLWIKATFTNNDAYRVIATGNSGFDIGAALKWVPAEGEAAPKTLTFDNSYEVTWGNAMKASGNVGFYIDFTGFSALAAGTLTLTPFVNSFNSASSVAYTHTAG